MEAKTIFELLQIKASDPKTTTGKIISEKLLIDLFSGDFKNINDLAKICNCSISTITKFVQSLGFVGYRELVFLMKMEKTQHDQKKFVNKNNSPNNERSFGYFTSVLQWISKNEKWFYDIVKAINVATEINIYTSHQTHPAAKYFYETLISIGKRPLLINPSHQTTLINIGDESNNKALNIFLISGRDNDTMFNFFLGRLNISMSNNFLIATSTSSKKIDLSKFQPLIINFEEETPIFIYRNWLFHTIFLSIFEIYNESSFQ